MRWTTLAVSAAAFLGMSTTTVPAAEVWIGGSRAWGDLTMPGQQDRWPFLRENADGLYINNFAMRPDESATPTRQQRIDGMYRLLKNKNLFYETDLKHSEDDFDARAIADLTKAGFDYKAVTINYGTSDARNKIITQDGRVPLFYMFGPWNADGDLNKPKNADLRANILKYAGASIDCPVVVWKDPPKDRGVKPAVYSAVKWCHAHEKKFLFLLAPNDSGPAFLEQAQRLVRQTEDHDANPDVWAVAFYGPQAFRDKLDVLPEADAAGRPAKTFCGTPYWLIHHLRDPKHWARLSLPDGSAAGPSAGGEVRVAVDLRNTSDWLDLAPVLRLRDTAGFTITATLDGVDVTARLARGIAFVDGDRLWPGASRHLVVMLTRDSAAVPSATPTLDLCPHPSEPGRINQSLPLLAGTAVAAR